MRLSMAKHLKKAAALAFIALAAFVFSAKGSARAAIPPALFTYQGKLLMNGSAPTGVMYITFSLYQSPSGGTPVYTAAGVPIAPTPIAVTPGQNGLFTVNLGGSGTNPLDPSIFQTNSSLYLEITVGTTTINGETLSPRKQLATAPFAFNAQYLNGYAASITPTSGSYVPVADSNGNFSFNGITSTGIVATGTSTFTAITLGGVTRTQWNTNFVGLSTSTYSGNISYNSYTGYEAANAICNANYSGSHFCAAGEIIATISDHNGGLSSVFHSNDNAWVSNGPPGYTANSNDCSGWTSSASNFLGPFWIYQTNGGGAGYVVNCSVTKPISCCR